MKSLIFLILAVIFWGNTAECQLTFKKEKDETVDDLIGRISAPAITTYETIKRVIPGKKTTIYIYFTENTVYDSSSVPGVRFTKNSIVAFSLITHDSVGFFHSVIDTLRFDNGYEMPEIKTVFFTNCDLDKEDELFILFSSFYEHHGLAGYIFKTFAYDLTNENGIGWKKNKKISSLFDDSEIGAVDDKATKKTRHIAKYNSAISIKRRLKELGY